MHTYNGLWIKPTLIPSPPVSSLFSNCTFPSQLHVKRKKKTLSSLTAAYVMGVGCLLEHALSIRVCTLKINWLPPAPNNQLPIASPAREWDFRSPSSLHVGILAGFIVYKRCAGSHSHYECMCAILSSCLARKKLQLCCRHLFPLTWIIFPTPSLSFVWLLIHGHIPYDL